ncbi:TetR/AcrR family transcriptional regulator [Mycetocola zhujimingii]|uniref:TetR family transcriptional regulator n=1 Tax=Mycetocola zhujimingii TaxID=2079792 RepID=A0A2U1TIB1_9MICO|nr:TetR/AcrR family transcriptional regulator [Mycetocola zhujimingii]PWC08631.1 TetR family transcriptional regulator [Mycetocola zhujimingii]
MSVTSATSAKRGAYAKTPARKAQIVEAAASVFSTRGYNGGSLREIASQLDVGLTSLVHHFPSKTDLLEAVLVYADEKYIGEFDMIAHDSGMRAAVLDLVERNFGHPELLRLLAVLGTECSSPGYPGNQWFVDRYSRLREEYRARFEHDQAVGRIPARRDPAVLATMLIGLWDGVQLQWLIDPGVDMVATIGAFFDEIEASR